VNNLAPPVLPAQEQVTITVVIPTFNRSALLSRAIESIRRQTYSDWKLVVVDNASPDDTSVVVAKAMQHDSRISYHRHDKNIGMLANWELACSAVETGYFSLLCDDDYLLPDFFQAAAREMNRHPEIGLCFGVTNVVDEDGRHLSVAPNEMATGYYSAGKGAVTMMTLQHPATPAILFRAACLKAVGGFDGRSLYVADLDMILRVALKYPVKFFEEESACYVVHANNSFKDVTGWHPGLLNLVRNLKKLNAVDPAHLAKIFNSFSKHAVLPLLILTLRDPGRMNFGVLNSAGRCLVEMRQVSNASLRLFAAVARRIGAIVSQFKLRVFTAPETVSARFIESIGSSDHAHNDAPTNAATDSRWALSLLMMLGLTVWLVVFGLAELIMVHMVERPLVKSRQLLGTIRQCFFG